MLNETARILCAIGYTSPTRFNDLLTKLGQGTVHDIEWRELFEMLETLEKQELITIERYHGRGRINTLQLTDLGAERAREALTGQDRCAQCAATAQTKGAPT